MVSLMSDFGQWKSIETAPKDGTRVLIWRKSYWRDHTFAAEFLQDDNRWTVFDGKEWHGLRGEYPTHWMPLPPAPTEGERS
jgi:hypothetical protein